MNHLLGGRVAECLWSGPDVHTHKLAHAHRLLQMTEMWECKSNSHKNWINTQKTDVNTHLSVCCYESFDRQVAPNPNPGHQKETPKPNFNLNPTLNL